MSLSRVRTRLADLSKKLDAVNLQTTPKIRFITVRPGDSLPDGKTEDDYDLVVYLSSEEFPHKHPGAWTSA